jgi:uncharacterized repeat protein (TIGR03847 family)
MARQLILFDRPRRFIAGTIGQPGERAFFLQVADASRVVSVGLEKQQVVVLADRLDQLLEEIATRSGATPVTAGPLDSGALEQPVEEEFRVGAMGLAWDEENNIVIVEAQAPVEETEDAAATLLEDDVEEGPDAVRIRLDPTMVRGFVDRARLVVAGGRPPCPLCGLPLSATGHICPRQNGYRRNLGTIR